MTHVPPIGRKAVQWVPVASVTPFPHRPRLKCMLRMVSRYGWHGPHKHWPVRRALTDNPRIGPKMGGPGGLSRTGKKCPNCPDWESY